MTTLEEAARQALEALEEFCECGTMLTPIERRDALRQAIEQPAQQQEPFGYFRYDLRLDAWVQNKAGLTGTPFYTSPPSKPWVSLTDEEVEEVNYVGLIRECYEVFSVDQKSVIEFARAIEKTLKEKNT